MQMKPLEIIFSYIRLTKLNKMATHTIVRAGANRFSNSVSENGNYWKTNLSLATNFKWAKHPEILLFEIYHTKNICLSTNI